MSPGRILPLEEVQAPFEIPDFESFPLQYGWPQESKSGYKIKEQLVGTERPMRVIHLGCGASGICLAKFLPERLKNVSFTCYDKNPEIGGTWYENRYPGCACDIPSVGYQFTWARNPNWSRFYSSATEIWQYFKDLVDEYGLMQHFKLSHEIVRADWDNDRGLWEVHVKNLVTGAIFVDVADVFINGGGILNHWKWPTIKGLTDFKGELYHTARYDDKAVLNNKRVAVIGIGSSGVQIIANIVSKVDKLFTWVRSPTWITAGFAQRFAGENGANFEYTEEQHKIWAENYPEYLKYCKDIEDELNQRFRFMLNGTAEAVEAKKFSVSEMSQKLNGRKDLIDKIIPKTFGVGCRRPTPGNGFLEALTQPHVTTFTQELQCITEKGFIDHEGNEHEVDVIICATGFDTSWIPRFPIVAHGKNIQDEFRGKTPLSYISVGVPDSKLPMMPDSLFFAPSSVVPNYFTVTGPYGPLGHGSFLPIIELLLSNFLTSIKKMQVERIKSMSPKREVCTAFQEHADLYLKRTAWTSGCTSWFKQGRKDGPLAIWPGTRLAYFDLLKSPRYEDFKIEYLGGNPFGHLGNGFTVKEYDGSDISYYLGTKQNPGGLMPSKLHRAVKGQVNGAVHWAVNGAVSEQANVAVNGAANDGANGAANNAAHGKAKGIAAANGAVHGAIVVNA